MKNFLKKPFAWAIVWGIVLTSASIFILLKAFVLPAPEQVAAETKNTSTAGSSQSSSAKSAEVKSTADSYESADLKIKITEKTVDNTKVYIADIQTTSANALKSAFAQNTYGRNLKEKTSAMAAENSAVLAINGDYYGFRSTGFVVRNGKKYRDTASDDTEALVVDKNGDFSIIDESTSTAAALDDAEQVFSFGPALIKDGKVSVSEEEEVSQSMNSNPRTAIAQIGKNHYAIIVSEGRTEESQGLSLYQLAEVFESLGAQTAYNLDGGGSSTLYFNGKVLNQTVGGAGSSQEREVSDIIYFK
ncbi:phosphodiester glycosidase family protein [Enterococcus hirae]|jgi:exopolysaccharide biosynthesis protein|nr:phosphodiester glycosidase family protein [Enterococcaceae bacterium]MCI1920244.1 phosphodiester glycosidase family protein [Enterococcaceae bacterium]MDM8214117.1 phosphodiester glycosidase family protein [Enterococcus hirae]